MADQLTALDATFLELEESDSSAHMHIGAVMVFEPTEAGPPSLRDLRSQIEERVDVLAHYRSRLSSERTGGLRWPSWEADPSFAIEDHVRRAALPSPGGRRELVEWAGDYWSSRLERDRPLWDVVLLEGLEGGRWALCTKTHHALVDGVGSVDVAHLLLDATREPQPRSGPHSAPAQAEQPSRMPAVLRDLEKTVSGGVRGGIDVALHPGKLREMVSRSKSLVELVVRDEVVAAPHTSLNVPLGHRRAFEVVTAELDDLKAIKNELGGTVNDVVLAVVSGGLRRLLESRGEEPPEGLRAMVPVNIRDAGERLKLGNKISSLFVHLPVAEADPLVCYSLAVHEAEGLKSHGQAVGGAALVSLAGMAPPMLHSFLARSLFASRLFNVTVTNVPGPQQPLYAFGARLEDVYPLVPLAAEHAVGIAVVSYAGRVAFGLNADSRAAPDVDVLRDGIDAALAELAQSAKIVRSARHQVKRSRTRASS